MKWFKFFVNEKDAKAVAGFMKYVCLIAILFHTLSLMLSFIGRQTFILQTGEKTYINAIFAQRHHDWWNYSNFRGFAVGLPEEIRVILIHDYIEVITQVGFSAMYAVHVIPLIIGFWFLSRVFSNINKGQIFIEQNALYLLYYGLIGIATAMFVPFIKLGIAGLTNMVSNNTVSISYINWSGSTLISSIAFIVAAYIIYYGVQLKDEVDHTL